MKLRVTRRRRLVAIPVEEDDARGVPGKGLESAPESTPEESRERLLQAIARTQRCMHKRQSPDEIVDSIRRGFPEPRFFIESNRRTMARVGLSRLDAFYYAMIPQLTRTCLSQRFGSAPMLDVVSRMAEYLRMLYVGVHVECFYLVMLNGQGRLIRSVLLQKGGVESTPFYLGQVLSTMLSENAKYIVLAHNHPRGTRNPSKEDLLCTLRVLNAVAPLRIPLLDHIIVVTGGAVSIRETGLIPDLLWTAAVPGNRLVRRWLDKELLAEMDVT